MWPRLGIALVALMTLVAPNASMADEPDPQTHRIRPADIKVSNFASQVVLGVQREEREEAKGGLKELEREIARLRGALERLENADRIAQLDRSLRAGQPLRSVNPVIASKQSSRRQEVLERRLQLAPYRTALEARAATAKSKRQRRVARRAAAKLAQLERELQDAVDAPQGERAIRLAKLRLRLVVDRNGLQEQPPNDPTPTFQILPPSALPAVKLTDRSP